MRLHGADAPADLVASSTSPAQAKWPRQQVLVISFPTTVRIVNFRCENIVLNTAMNKCQYELYRSTVFSVRNRMDLYRFMTFQALEKVFKFIKIPTSNLNCCRTCPIDNYSIPIQDQILVFYRLFPGISLG